MYLIMELLTGGELLDAVLDKGSYSEADARLCFLQLLRGIHYLHSQCALRPRPPLPPWRGVQAWVVLPQDVHRLSAHEVLESPRLGVGGLGRSRSACVIGTDGQEDSPSVYTFSSHGVDRLGSSPPASRDRAAAAAPPCATSSRCRVRVQGSCGAARTPSASALRLRVAGLSRPSSHSLYQAHVGGPECVSVVPYSTGRLSVFFWHYTAVLLVSRFDTATSALTRAAAGSILQRRACASAAHVQKAHPGGWLLQGQAACRPTRTRGRWTASRDCRNVGSLTTDFRVNAVRRLGISAVKIATFTRPPPCRYVQG